MVKPNQIREWTENPVTIALKEKIRKQSDSILSTPVSDAVVRGSPEKTHENIIELNVMFLDYLDFQKYLEGDWDDFEEEEEPIEYQ